MLRRLNDRDQLGKGAAQGSVNGPRPLLPAQVLVHTVLQAGEELIRVLVLPAQPASGVFCYQSKEWGGIIPIASSDRTAKCQASSSMPRPCRARRARISKKASSAACLMLTGWPS